MESPVAERGVGVLWILLALVLLLPGAAGETVTGSLVGEPPSLLLGPLDVSASPILLVIQPSMDSEPLHLTAAAALVHDQSIYYTRVDARETSLNLGGDGTHANASYVDLGLTIIPMGPEAFLAFGPRYSGAAHFDLTSAEAGEFEVLTSGPREITSSPFATTEGEPSPAFFTAAIPEHLALSPLPAASLLQGDLTLYVWGSRVLVDDAEGFHEYETGETVVRESPITENRTYRWLTIDLKGATLALGEQGAFGHLLTSGLDGTAAGLKLPQARGRLETEEASYAAGGETASLEGTLELRLQIEGAERQALLTPDVPPLLRVGIAGDLEAVNLAATPRPGPSTAVGAFLKTPEGQVAVAGGVTTLAVLGVGMYVRVNRGASAFAFAGVSRRAEAIASLEARAYRWEQRRVPLLSPVFALAALNRLVLIAPPDAVRHRHGRARALLALGRHNRALEDLRLLASLAPRRDEVRYDLARALAARAASRGEALVELEAALRLDPSLKGAAAKERAFRALRADPRFQALMRDA